MGILHGGANLALAETISGLRKPRTGTVQINGTVLNAACPKPARQAGLAYVPEERQRQGAILGFSVRENLTLAALGRKLRGPWLRPAAEVVAKVVRVEGMSHIEAARRDGGGIGQL